MTAIRTPDPADQPGAALPPAGPVDIDRVRDLLDGLDLRQRQAVTHGDGPLLVLAGPGTGKTEVITRRVAWLIASRRARPAEILALTFTERAADEMQARVDLLVPYGQADTAIHTFHAFGDWVLREHGHATGGTTAPRVVGRSAAMVLLRDNVFDLGLERYLPLGDPTRFVGALVDLFGRAKEEGLGPDDLAEYARALRAGASAAREAVATTEAGEAVEGLLDEADAYDEIATAFAAYQRLLLERSLVDHADQVAQAVHLLTERPAVRQELRRRFRYVVVDEAQDANPQQMRLVRQLVGAGGNVAFVGDDDQAIYGFRGAVGSGLSGSAELFDGVRDIALRRNYRSRKPILTTARRLIRHNDPDRLEVQRGVDKTLTAVRRSRRPAPVRHRVYATADDEADAVAAEVAERLKAGTPPGEIAVLTRTNADAGPVLASLDVRGVPRRFSGASGLLRHREARDLLAVMRAVAAPESSDDMYAVMTSAPFGLAGADLTTICGMASRRRRSLWSIVLELQDQPDLLRLSQDSRQRLDRLASHMRAAIDDAHERPAPVVLYAFLRETGWLRLLVAAAERGDDGPVRRVARLFDIVKEQAELTSDPRMALVAPALAALLETGADPVAPDADDLESAVSVLTVHQAKGLEFPIVFVIGVAEGRFPVRGRRDPLELPPALTGRPPRGDNDAHLAEERRLFYVAITRARDELFLSHAITGARGGRTRRPSRFLAEALGRPVEDGVAPETESILAPPSEPTGPDSPAVVRDQGAPLSLSFTQIDDYLACPMKYKLRHVVRVPTPPHHALVLGNALHQAVAVANKARLEGRVIDRGQIQATLDAHWTSEGFLSQAHEAARYQAGKAALARFVDDAGSEGDAILAVERPFSVRIGKDRIRGRYDAVRRGPEGIVITDYKSGDMRDVGRARQRARRSLQLQLYALAWEAEEGGRPDAVELHFLEGGVVGRVTPTDKRLHQAGQQVERAAAGIRAGDFDATPGYPACEWCPYRRICPAAA